MKNPLAKHKLAIASGVLLSSLGLSVAIMQPSVALETPPPAIGVLPDLTQMIKSVSPAVVNISVEGHSNTTENLDDLPEPFRDFFRNLPQQQPPAYQRPQQGFGSGFIISPDGYIVTNAHVVDGADKITVSLNDKREFEGKLIGADKLSDIALVKIDANQLPSMVLGNSDDLNVGQWVVAIGAPFGLDYTATQGIVSALSRSLPTETYVPFIQTDAAVNPGNSGGPLLDLQGNVIGVNSQIYSRSGGYMGVSFAIPINVVKAVTEQLRDGGKVSRGWLGVEIGDVDPKLAQAFHLEQAKGALVAGVEPNGPADKAGVQAGDVIMSYDGKTIQSSRDLPLLVGNTSIGKTVSLEVWRDGKAKTLTASIDKLASKDTKEEATSNKLDKGALGVSVEDLTNAERKENKLDERGVIIRQVAPDSPADDAGLQEGDIILSINNKPVTSTTTLKELVNNNPTDKPMAILYQRDGRNRFTAVTLNNK